MRASFPAPLSRLAAGVRGLLRPRRDGHPRSLDEFRERYCRPAKVRFLGVWDTVDAVGFPFAGMSGAFNRLVYRFKFPDLKLGACVQKACHAIALDDERRTFHPILWNEEDEGEGRIEQVWFAGAHSNVGGGYPHQGLALVSLDWMMHHAEKAGLAFIPADRLHAREHLDSFGHLYDSRSGLAKYYRYAPRDVEALCRAQSTPVRVHESVFRRIARRAEGYAPGNLPRSFILEGNAGPRWVDLTARIYPRLQRFVRAHQLLYWLLVVGTLVGTSLLAFVVRPGVPLTDVTGWLTAFLRSTWLSVPTLLIWAAMVWFGWRETRLMRTATMRFWRENREQLEPSERPAVAARVGVRRRRRARRR